MENYQFVKQIGHGSYGEIWLVKCSKTRKKHVLKRIDLHRVSKREQRAAHLEAKFLSTIKHPNIVTYLDSFHNSSGSLFIVMNYCESGDLYTFIKNQNGVYFEEKQIVHWFVQICLAIKYLHDKNILHRNLKTKNIFLTKNKIIKVGDLGISKVLSVAHEMTTTLIETPYYVSPEMFSGKPYNEKSDIYALGCCTYEIATLKHPFIAQDIHSLLHKIMKRQLPPIPKMYSSELYEIICLMLDKESENRPCVTELLLNDYIRRYILLILQGDSKSPDSQVSENSSELSMKRSKSNSDLTLTVSRGGSSDIQRSMSTCFLPKNKSKNSKPSASKLKVGDSKSVIISVPDVNGNGDGNDNSQHGRMINSNRKAYYNNVTKGEMNCENDSKIFLNIDNDAKKAVKQKMNSVPSSSTSSSHSEKSSEISNAFKQKMKSEISFQILNNLAYSLQTARQNNFNQNSGYISSRNSPFEPLYLNTRNSKSPEGSSTGKQSALCAKKTVKNEDELEKTISQGNPQSNVCKLPQIKHEIKNEKISKSANLSKNLPLVKSQNLKGNKSVLKKPAGKMDNLILKKAKESNKLASMC